MDIISFCLCARCEQLHILIAIKQPHFNTQKGRLNEQSLAEKIDSKILISYGIESNITIYRKSAF